MRLDNGLTGARTFDREVRPRATLAGLMALSYSYDAAGNLLSKTWVSSYTYGSGSTTTSQAGPHAVKTAGGNSYTYDANGNMTGGAGRTRCAPLSCLRGNDEKRIDKRFLR